MVLVLPACGCHGVRRLVVFNAAGLLVAGERDGEYVQPIPTSGESQRLVDRGGWAGI